MRTDGCRWWDEEGAQLLSGRVLLAKLAFYLDADSIVWTASFGQELAVVIPQIVTLDQIIGRYSFMRASCSRKIRPAHEPRSRQSTGVYFVTEESLEVSSCVKDE